MRSTFSRSLSDLVSSAKSKSTGKKCFRKAHTTGSPFDLDIERELSTLLTLEKIRSETTTSRTLQVPRLCGYVEDAESGRIIGLLRQ